MLNKKNGLLILLILVGSLLFTGCSSNSSSDSSTPDSESYTLTVITEGEGNVIEEEIITTKDYENGTAVKLSAVTDVENWLFSHWEGDYNGNENPIEVIMDGNKTITAVFQATVLVGSEPFEITNWHQLNEVRDNLTFNYILMEDLDQNSLGYGEFVDYQKGWDPIGEDVEAYLGNFDGNNKVINDLYINRGTEDYIGLFAKSGGIIENLEIEVLNLTGNKNVGGLVGENEGDIINCNVSGTIEGNEYVGGLIGTNKGSINYSWATGEISGSGYLGGLVGLNFVGSEIFKSYAQADVTGENNNIGGLIGYNSGLVTDCYAIGRISGYEDGGGLIGFMNDSPAAIINSSYSAGEVFFDNTYGGLIGFNLGTDNINYSYWDTEAGNGINYSDGGEGKTTSEMSQKNTFVGWDFTDTWDIEEGKTYPYLKWQVDNIPNIPTG